MHNRQIMNNPNIRGHVRTLSYGDQLLRINAHRIQPTTILYNSINEYGIAMITDEQMLRNLTDVRPFGNCGFGGNAPSAIRWGIAYFTHQVHDSDRYCFDLMLETFRDCINRWFPNENVKGDMNLIMDPYGYPIEIKSPPPSDLDLYQRNMIKYLEGAICEYQLQGVVVILPSLCSRDDVAMDAIYNTVKVIGNIKTGIITQCIRASTVCSQTRGFNDAKRQNKTRQSLLGTFRQFMVCNVYILNSLNTQTVCVR